ncbi:VOC family protein [Spartinivicinus ruber]|uniref:VOC family protein n=1 Tax=Spartinivicinus ruber TaxID=2683272 RepID=UPI0013D57BBB|nr:VOC family protein [Spartinivicinus ruber]
MFKQIHHIAITCKSLEKLKEFYIKLGFKLQKSYQDDEVIIAHLNLKGTLIELFEFNGSIKSIRVKRWDIKLKEPGLVHFALAVDDIKAAKQWVNDQLSVSTTEVTYGRTGINYFFMHDPEGNAIEVVECN